MPAVITPVVNIGIMAIPSVNPIAKKPNNTAVARDQSTFPTD